MDRHAHTRPDRAQWTVEPCEWRETGTATTRRASVSQACATNLGVELKIRANSTRVG
jgi:hypothetical protein